MTGRPCLVCERDDRAEIELALLRHDAGLRSLAVRFGSLTHASLRRHLTNHMGYTVAQTKEFRSVLSAENLLEKIGQWHERMEQQYQNADAAGNIMGAVATARTGLSAIDSYAKITVETELQREVAELEQQLQALQTPPTETNQ